MKKRISCYGFTLVELLSVLALMALLLTMTVPAITSTVGSMRVTSAAQQIVDEINFARATALARNLPVEVCFLQVAKAGESTEVYRAIQSRLVEPDGKKPWISRMQRLPEGTSISSRADRSTVFGCVDGAYAIENVSSGTSKGVAMRIYPSAEVEVVNKDGDVVGSSVSLFLTIGRGADIDNANLPPNFAAIQINSRNARVTTYQP